MKILACPICKSDVKLEDKKLICSNCKAEYEIDDEIPIMLPPSMSADLKLTEEKCNAIWNTVYKTQKVEKINLEKDLQLRDAYVHIKKHMKSHTGIFLEAGSGQSTISSMLSKDGINTVGIDISLAALKNSRKLFEIENTTGFFVCGNILNMPFKDYSFSFIYGGGVIEHFKNTQQCANELFRCTSRGGVVTCTIPTVSLSTPYMMLRGNIPSLPIIKRIIEYIQIDKLKGRFMQCGYERSFTVGK